MIASANGDMAPHGIPYDPPPCNLVLALIKQAVAEGVDRQLAASAKKVEDHDWLFYAARDLMEVLFRDIWKVAETARESRKVAEQNSIFKLNHHLMRVVDMLRDPKLTYVPREGWNLGEWKSQQRTNAEYEAAKASLPVKLRGEHSQVRWVLEEKEMRKAHAKQERVIAKRFKDKIASGKMSKKELAELEERRAAREGELERKIQEKKEWHLGAAERNKAALLSSRAAKSKKVK
jgi:type II secretory pathway component PulJ